jgi:hypothetical protein
VQWSDGAIALPFESHKPFDDPDPARRDVQASWLMVSKDFGTTFTGPYLVAQHPQHTVYYWDQRVCAGKQSGDYCALFWTHDRGLGRDVNVHMKQGRLAPADASSETVQDTMMPGQIATPTYLPGGQLCALVVDRRWPGKIALWLSKDNGASWLEQAPAYVHSGAAPSGYGSDTVKYAEVWESLEKWRFGHPMMRVLTDRLGLITYYAGTAAGLDIHWARVEWE